MSNKIGRVVVSYTAEASTALTITSNSLVDIISDQSSDWWYVSYNGQMGYFPARCLQVLG
jgi:hypothetical protein